MNNLRGELHHQHNLAMYTSWRIGGDAEHFYRPADLEDLQHFLKQLPDNEPLTWLGLGSNVLIRDGGIPGTVILTLNRLNQLSMNPEGLIRAEAGVTCAKLAKYCAKQGLAEGAFFSGIPGTIGGALAMNAGAYGGETWEHVVRVEIMNRHGDISLCDRDKFKIGYREVEGLNEAFFIAGIFKFSSGNVAEAETAIRLLLKKRNESQPIGSYNCGSVFRNPPGDHAARLIETAGLKGYKIGGAEVSQKHANFILNTGNATAADIEQLIDYVARKVREVHGVSLIKEVRILGLTFKSSSKLL